ncbi:MAG TPA: glycosyltransferase [Solirubrobacteraceae bacterium]|nr:glycosyltransferase [Solirubrobacteraceae bacterium]
MPRILFVNPNHEDYLADGVFHGLRSVLGADAIDYPKAEYLYEDVSPEVIERVRGGGFTLYGLLPDLPVERDHVLPRALDGEFELVVFGDIWRCFGLWTEWSPQLRAAGVPMVVLDGSDRVEPYPYAGLWWRVRAWWFLPRAHNRARYFKREITPLTRWFASYLLLPPALGRRLDLQPIAFSIPAEKIVAEAPAKETDFPTHVVDAEVAGRVGGQTGYAFEHESDYRSDLARSRFGVTTKRAGWDALRHYEIAASGAVPCFRDLHLKPATCAPFGLDDTNCIAYRDAEDLLAQVAALDDAGYARLQAGALAWARANTTIVRARELLERCGVRAPVGAPP